MYYDDEEPASRRRPLIIAVIVLSVLLCATGGYLLYDKVYLPGKANSGQGIGKSPYDGDYHMEGVIARRWNFDMELHIDEGDVTGRFIVPSNHLGYITLRGSADDDGWMEISEYDKDGILTGYYFSGQLTGSSYAGKYRDKKGRTDDLPFHASSTE